MALPVPAQEKKKEAPAATAAAATPAPAPAPIDPTVAPNGPDTSGAGYVGVPSTAGLSKDGDKITTESLARDMKQMKLALNIMWTLITGFLVMFMQAGFALVESGLTRAKNVGHTMGMNFVIYAIGRLGFWICGFALMFGGLGAVAAWDSPAILDKMFSMMVGGKTWDLIGYKGFFLIGPAMDTTVLTLFLFQMVFMDTTATIPTGAMAERWKFSAFMVYGFFLSTAPARPRRGGPPPESRGGPPSPFLLDWKGGTIEAGIRQDESHEGREGPAGRAQDARGEPTPLALVLFSFFLTVADFGTVVAGQAGPFGPFPRANRGTEPLPSSMIPEEGSPVRDRGAP